MAEGFTRRSLADRELQPVAIVSVDPTSRTAIGVTRTRHSININCAYATGDTITIPASGEQWYVERFDMEWRLYGRIPFNDPTLNITPEIGQVSVGGALGPLELNGTEARINAPVFRLGGVYYRDNGTGLERSSDQITWTAITASAGVGGIVQMIAQSLTGFDGSDQTLALLSLENWSAVLTTIIDNFSAFWNEFCQNVFVAGLKRMGYGETDLAKIVDGFQNFVNYLFGVIFCDFDGNLTPQTVLARLRDLLAPIIANPFVQGLSGIADILGVAAGNLLNDAVAGITGLIELVYNIITCNWDVLATQAQEILEIIGLVGEDSPFGPANIIKSLFETFQFLGSPEIDGMPNPVGIFLTALKTIAEGLGVTVTNLAEGALAGAVELFNLIFRIITCDPTALTDLQTLMGLGTDGLFDNLGVLEGLLTSFQNNPLVVMISDFATTVLGNTGTLLQQIVETTGDLMNLFLKVIKDILPFDDVWTQLFPFINWGAVDATVLPDLTTILDGKPLWHIIFYPVDLLIQTIIPAVGNHAFTNFVENITTLLGGAAGLFTTFFEPLGSKTWQNLVDDFLQNVLQIITIDPITKAKKLVDGLVGAATDLLTRLLAVFGIDFDPKDPVTGEPIPFNPVTALATAAGKIAQEIFGIAGAEVSRAFTRLVNMFGGLTGFLTTGTFDFAAAATSFINTVLYVAPAAAVSVLQGVIETTTSLAYRAITALIQGIRGSVPIFGNPIADALQFALNLLTNFTGFGRGTVQSGSNLLSDPAAERSAFWNQTGVTWQTTMKKSSTASLMVSGGNVLWFNVNDLGEVVPIITRPDEYMHMECYINSYYNTTVYLYAKADNSADGSTYTYYLTSVNVGPAYGGWNVKAQADIQIPAPWDRVSFGVYAVSYPVYVDDMLVREITASQTVKGTVTNLNYALYGSTATPTLGTPISVNNMPTGIPATNVAGSGGVGTLGGEVSTLGGTVGSTTNGTGLAGTVYGTNGSGGLVGTGGSVPTLQGSVGTTAAGTGLSGTVYGKGGVGGLVGTGGTTTTVTTTYNGVYGAGGLIPNLYGSGATSPQATIQVTALPTKLQSVGSGVTLQRTTSNPTPYSTLKVTNIMMANGFYDSGYSSSDFNVLNIGGYTMVRATNAGWYQVEMSFGLTRAFSNYPWYFDPILFKNSQPVKYGNGAVNIPLTTAVGTVYASYVPEVVQSAFIIYLAANETLAPGYGWRPEAGTPASDTIIIANAPNASNAAITYFSVSLLNRSLA